MTYLSAQPHLMAAAAAEVAGIGSAIDEATAAAASTTTGVAAAAADDVSAATARLFNTFARECQVVLAQAADFHREFARALLATQGAYLAAEVANVGAVNAGGAVSAVTSPAAAQPLVALAMGGTANPTPTTAYVDAVNSLFIQRSAPGAIPQALATPAALYPVTGVRDLVFDMSVRNGVSVLDTAINAQLAAGNHVTVFGYSQSAVIASLEMRQLAALGPNAPSPAELDFVLIGNLMNPNGGIFQRFAGLTFPALGLTFAGATPDNLYPTTIYTREYDGFADFPQYPLNFVSVLNAYAGVGFVHFGYAQLTPEQIDSAVTLPTQGPTMTTYKMIPTEDLPLLAPLRAIPILGKPLASLIEPDLRVIVNLGYGDPAYGYSTGPANVPTPFGLFPPVSLDTVVDALAAGSQQGIRDFAADLQQLSSAPISVPPLSTPGVTSPATGLVVPTPNDVAGAVASIVSTDYALLLPMADLALSAVVGLPAYDATQFARGLAEGSLVNAIGYPFTATVTLLPMAGVLGGLAIGRALAANISDIEGLIS
ncbi:PE-PPE domain-containing protein [Mycobacterium shinjukuense]|uniref:PE family protein n=1 Tax=Mycobacterium shinjukuense TaxID=398694 RepID=A0A7I7MLH9_9MYCO|nr:PE-PPE domain-containing protein [Mycobacterium shinjukuense]MCV6984400.1 PE-PPE domain-containing protein [Mycobacterium shinjukuense]ORB71005.1 PE family protein [Mycobacterium shinjukuense]BBX73124.1 PE family protein [Mycobacterium shinjukuense]